MYHTYRTDTDTVVDEYDSTHALLERMRSSLTKDDRAHRYGSRRNIAMATDQDGDWSTYSRFQDFLTSVEREDERTYQNVFDRAENTVKDITHNAHWETVSFKRTREYASSGMRVHRSRLYSGKAHKAFSRYRRQARLDRSGVVTIVIPTDAAYYISTESIYLYRLAGYALATVLERIGKQTEIYGYSRHDAMFIDKEASEKFTKNGGYCSYVWLHRIKSARERYQLNAIVPLLFSDYTRRFIFRSAEMHMGKGATRTSLDVSGVYGYSATEKPEAWDWLVRWAEQQYIDTDTLLMTPDVHNGNLTSVADVQAWVQETLDSLNQPMSA